jgi:hypothetical protein
MVSYIPVRKRCFDKGETYPVVGRALQKATDDCNPLLSVPVEAAATKCTPQCNGISDTITTLTTDPDYLDDTVDNHNDVLVCNFTSVHKEVGDDFCNQS